MSKRVELHENAQATVEDQNVKIDRTNGKHEELLILIESLHFMPPVSVSFLLFYFFFNSLLGKSFTNF